MQKLRGAAFSLAALALTGCGPKVAGEGAAQIFRAGEIEVRLTAPAWVTRQEFYPLGVTYTNRAAQPVEFSDPFHCSFIWNVEEASSGEVPQPPGQSNYGCTTDIPPLKTLAPGESYAGEFRAIIGKFPRGNYRIAPEDLGGLRLLNLRVGGGERRAPEFTPAPQEIRFEIR